MELRKLFFVALAFIILSSSGFSAVFTLIPQYLNSTSGKVSVILYNNDSSNIQDINFASDDFAISSIDIGGCENSAFSFLCEMNLPPNLQLSIPFSYLANPGQHNISISSSNQIGNEFVLNTFLWVDIDKPIIQKIEMEYPGNNLAAKTGASIILKAFAFDTSTPLKSVVVKAPEIGCPNLELNKGLSYWSGVCKVSGSDGLKIGKAIAYDLAGNYVEKKFSIIIDNTPTSIQLNEYRNASKRGDTVKFSFSLGETGTDVKEVKIDMKELGCQVEALTEINGEYTALCTVVADEGEYKVIINAYDYAGNVDEKIIKFFVDDTKPIIEKIDLIYPRGQTHIKKDDLLLINVYTIDELSGVHQISGNSKKLDCKALSFSDKVNYWRGICNVTSYQEGEDILEIFVKDEAENIANKSETVYMDNTVPNQIEIISINSSRPINNLKNGDVLSFIINSFDSQSGVKGVKVFGTGTGCTAELNDFDGYWGGFCKVYQAALGPKSIIIMSYDYANNTRHTSINIQVNDTFCDKDCPSGQLLNYTTCTCERRECNKICPPGLNLDRNKCTCVPPKICSKLCPEGEELNLDLCICEEEPEKEVADYTWIIYLGIVIVILIPMTFALNSKMINSLKKYD